MLSFVITYCIAGAAKVGVKRSAGLNGITLAVFGILAILPYIFLAAKVFPGIIPLQFAALIVFIASSSVIVAYFAVSSRILGMIIRYAQVGTTFGLITILLFTFLSTRCCMRPNTAWWFISLGIAGVAISVAYLAVAS